MLFANRKYSKKKLRNGASEIKRREELRDRPFEPPWWIPENPDLERQVPGQVAAELIEVGSDDMVVPGWGECHLPL